MWCANPAAHLHPGDERPRRPPPAVVVTPGSEYGYALIGQQRVIVEPQTRRGAGPAVVASGRE